MTSLFQALFSPNPVQTPGRGDKVVGRHYFLDMEKALASGGDMIDAIIWTGSDRTRKALGNKGHDLDVSTPELQYKHSLFPLDQTFDNKDWFFGYQDFWKEQGEDKYELRRNFDKNILSVIENYEMPIIRLLRQSSREAICLIFEKVNVGGKKLDAFELVTAIFAGEEGEEFNLREDWQVRQNSFMSIAPGQERYVLRKVEPVNFLQVSTFLHTRERRIAAASSGKSGKDLPQVSIRRKDVLALPYDSYKKTADAVTEGFRRAATFLNERKIFWHRDVPYPPQIVALAAFYATWGKKELSAPQAEKLSRWFWAIALGEEYGSGTETKIARDVTELLAWLEGNGHGPRTMREAQFNADRLDTLRTRLSAAYKAVHALLMEVGCKDFISGRSADVMSVTNDQIDIHHIFPQAWCEKNHIEPAVYNSILNKTPLSAASNRSVGGQAPSAYLADIQNKKKLGETELDSILRTHLIDPVELRQDDFLAFMEARRTKLLALILNAMGASTENEVKHSEVA